MLTAARCHVACNGTGARLMLMRSLEYQAVAGGGR
jgi:hypothetical protein